MPTESVSRPQLLTAYLGRIPYANAWDLQRQVADLRARDLIPDVLLLLEHPPTYTLGRRGKASNILLSASQLREKGIEVFDVDRGGDVTYHGPGQIVGYPIMRLDLQRPDIIKYVRMLEEVLIRSLAEFEIVAGRIEGLSGVWVANAKVAAIGVKFGSVTSHGFALNVHTDMSYFEHIIPCGITDKGVTSIHLLSEDHPSLDQVARTITVHFGEVFQRIEADISALEPASSFSRAGETVVLEHD
jgi:lipoate-protein ligase B